MSKCEPNSCIKQFGFDPEESYGGSIIVAQCYEMFEAMKILQVQARKDIPREYHSKLCFFNMFWRLGPLPKGFCCGVFWNYNDHYGFGKDKRRVG